VDTTTDDLIKLRERIMEQTIPLLDTDDIPLDERFRLTLQIARMKGTADIYEKALELANRMEGDEKLDAHLDLLAGVDVALQGKAEVTSRLVEAEFADEADEAEAEEEESEEQTADENQPASTRIAIQ
jgi:hypothetical protein